MRILSERFRAFVLPLTLLGFLATASLGAAAINNHSGTGCKNYDAGDEKYIDYFTYGTRSLKDAATRVICPLVRSTSASNGATIYVDLVHFGEQTTTCSAYSYNWTGALLASTSLTWTGTGLHEYALNLTGAGKSATWSDYSVLCTIPGNRNSVIYGVDLSE